MSPDSPIDTLTWIRHALLNRVQSVLLLAVMAGFLALLGWLLWGRDGIYTLLFSGALLLLMNPVITPQLVMRMYRAQPLAEAEAPTLHQAVRELAQRAGLPHTPALYYVPSSMINAFAVGRRNQAAIAITDGLLRTLNTREIVGVLAHEISHIRNNDTWVMGLADMFSRLTSSLSLFGQILLLINLPLLMLSAVTINWFAIFILIFAPTLSALAQLGLSRTREYDADLNAALLTGDPEGLAQALAKLEQAHGTLMERIFLPGRGIPEPSLLRTHPPTEERIRRLLSLQRPAGVQRFKLASNTGPAADQLARSAIERVPGWHISGLWH